MIPLKRPDPTTPEAKIQAAVIKKMTLRGWFVKSTHGNANQKGLPDLFCAHTSYGIRWVEIKRPTGARFTKDQLTVFTGFASKNVGVWVMTSEDDYDQLFKPANWYVHLLNSRGVTVDKKVELYPKKGPEAIIQNELVTQLKMREYFVVETYGSQFQAGFPDVYACHKEFGSRWIEVKNPKRWSFTSAQIKLFPRFMAEGVGIYILTGYGQDDIDKLHKPANLYEYMK
jgi:hypothetical protein